MSEKNTYRINEKEVAVSQKIATSLKKSDRRMRYYEHDIKIERPIYGQDKQVIGFRASKEVSMTLLTESGIEFEDPSVNVEEAAIGSIMRQNLREALKLLDEDELRLIRLRYIDEVSQPECSRTLGIPQQTISYREKIILAKLHKLLSKG